MKRIISFILLNFFEGVREKIFWGVVFFFLFLLGLTFFLSILSVGESTQVLRGAGLSAMEVCGLLLLIFSLTYGFYSDKNSRILEVYLTYSPRYIYIASKLLAYLLIAFFYLILSGTLWIIILILNKAFYWGLLAGIFSLFLKFSIAVALNLLFCCIFTSPAFALLGTLFIYAAGSIASEAFKVLSVYSQNQSFLWAFKFLCYLLPNLDKLDLKYQLIYGGFPSISYFPSTIFYTLFYCFFLWGLCTRIFIKEK